MLGLGLDRPTPTDAPIPGAAATFFTSITGPVAVIIVGLVLTVLGLAWLAAQVPRRDAAKPFRLHDDTDSGLTRCEPKVLTEAVGRQVETLNGVQRATALMRGTAAEPELFLKVVVTDRIQIQRLLDSLQSEVADDLGRALDTQVALLGVQVEVDRERVSQREVTV